MSETLNNPAGIILEYFYLTKNADQKRQSEWENEYLSNTPTHVWGKNVDLSSLRYYLEKGRENRVFRPKFNRVLRSLIHNDLIEKDPSDDNPDTNHYVITCIGEYAFLNDCYLEIINGLRYICDKYKNSVAKLSSSSDSGIGTGFLIENNLIATAKHVVDELEDIKIEFEDGLDVTAKNILRPQELTDLDLAIIEIQEILKDRKIFKLQKDRNILDDVLILGYPPIPKSDDAYLVANSGEISSIINLYHNNIQGIVVSSLLRGGNSGGPIINFRGEVIGIISINLYKEIAKEDDIINDKLAFAYGIGSEFLQDLIQGKV